MVCKLVCHKPCRKTTTAYVIQDLAWHGQLQLCACHYLSTPMLGVQEWCTLKPIFSHEIFKRFFAAGF